MKLPGPCKNVLSRMNVKIFNAMANLWKGSIFLISFSTIMDGHKGVSNVYVTITLTRDTHRKKHG